MPSLREHIELCRKRQGRGFEEVHKWLDSPEIPLFLRILRHMPFLSERNGKRIENLFGKDARRAFENHIRDDMECAKKKIMSILLPRRRAN